MDLSKNYDVSLSNNYAMKRFIDDLIKQDTEKFHLNVLNQEDIRKSTKILAKFYDYMDKVEKQIVDWQSDPDISEFDLNTFNKNVNITIRPLLAKAQQLQQQYYEISSVLGRTTPVNVSTNPNLEPKFEYAESLSVYPNALPPSEYQESSSRFYEPSESLPMTTPINQSSEISTRIPHEIVRIPPTYPVKHKFEILPSNINGIIDLIKTQPLMRDKLLSSLSNELVKGNISKQDVEKINESLKNYDITEPFEYKTYKYAPTVKKQNLEIFNIYKFIPNYNPIKILN